MPRYQPRHTCPDWEHMPCMCAHLSCSSRPTLHRYFEETLRPYMRSVGDEASTSPDSSLVFLDCLVYQHLLKVRAWAGCG